MESYQIPVNVLAQILNVTERMIRFRIDQGQYKAIEVKSSRGGNNGFQKLVLFSSLNPEEQKAVLNQEISQLLPSQIFPFDVKQYIEEYGIEEFQKALMREQACKEIIVTRQEPFPKKKLGLLYDKWTEKLGLKNEKYLMKIVREYIEGGFQSLLHKKRFDKGTRRSICQAGENLVKDLYLTEYKPSKMDVYKEALRQATEEFGSDFCQECDFKDKCQEAVQSGIKIGSYATVDRVIQTIPPAEIVRFRYGKEEWQKKIMPKARLSREGIPLFYRGVLDHQKLDLLVRYPDGSIGRIWLTAIIDFRSNVILGWVLCREQSSATIAETLRQIVKVHGNMVYELYEDNGRPERSNFLSGKETVFETVEEYLATCDGVYKAIGIQNVRRAKKRSPWSKGSIERFFRTVSEGFCKHQETWLGSKPSDRPTDWQATLKKLKDDQRIPTVDIIVKRFQEWLEKYHHTVQQDLGGSPMEVFQTTEKYQAAVPTGEALAMIMTHVTTRVIQTDGIQLENRYYQNIKELAAYVRTKVIIRYDPAFTDEVYVFTTDNKYICTARLRKDLSPRSSSEEIAEHIALQKGAHKELVERRNGYKINQGKKPHKIYTSEVAATTEPTAIKLTGFEGINRNKSSVPTSGSGKIRSAFDNYLIEKAEKALAK
ncbi:MAG: Mu transposase C-terminal domain-containing protein [Bacteroidota bacterium]